MDRCGYRAMLSDAIGAKTKIPANGHAVVGIDRRASHNGKTVGFFWRTVADFSQRGRLLPNGYQKQAIAKSLRSRRICALADVIYLYAFCPVMLRYRRSDYQAYRRSRFIGKLTFSVGTQRPQSTWVRTKNQPLPWQTGRDVLIGNALIGNKVIIAERHSVFCQLLFDYYAAARPPGEPSCCTAHRPDFFYDYAERCPPQEGREAPGDDPRGFYDARFFSTASEPCLVLFRKSRFGFWHIKVLAALLLLFILTAGLDALTGIQGYCSLHTLSAAGLLSGLIVALAMVALLVLVMCLLRR